MKQQNKKHLKSFVAVLLAVTVLIGGAIAFLTATDSRKNVFTIGNVAVELIEEGWVQDGENWTRDDGGNLLIAPGAEIAKAPSVKNTGNAEAWVYMTVGIPTVESIPGESILVNTGELYVPVATYAIQEGYEGKSGYTDIWSTFFDAEEMFGTELADNSNRAPLFNIQTQDNFNELGYGWELMSETPYSVDGYNYYTYVYQSKLQPGNTTSALFEEVVFDSSVVVSELPGVDTIFNAETGMNEEPAEDYVPEEGDKTVMANTGNTATFTDGNWLVDGNINGGNPVGSLPEELFGAPVVDKDPYFVAKDYENDADECRIVKDTKINYSAAGNYIYSLEEKLTKERLLNYYFDYYNVEIEVTDNDPTTLYLGNGSTVKVTFPDGTIDEYSIIIFGDTNGDSIVDTNDAEVVFKVLVGESSPLSGVTKMAANVSDVRMVINDNDLTRLDCHSKYLSRPDFYSHYADMVIDQSDYDDM